jgi:hypothetical protein
VVVAVQDAADARLVHMERRERDYRGGNHPAVVICVPRSN